MLPSSAWPCRACVTSFLKKFSVHAACTFFLTSFCSFCGFLFLFVSFPQEGFCAKKKKHIKHLQQKKVILLTTPIGLWSPHRPNHSGYFQTNKHEQQQQQQTTEHLCHEESSMSTEHSNEHEHEHHKHNHHERNNNDNNNNALVTVMVITPTKTKQQQQQNNKETMTHLLQHFFTDAAVLTSFSFFASPLFLCWHCFFLFCFWFAFCFFAQCHKPSTWECTEFKLTFEAQFLESDDSDTPSSQEEKNEDNINESNPNTCLDEEKTSFCWWFLEWKTFVGVFITSAFLFFFLSAEKTGHALLPMPSRWPFCCCFVVVFWMTKWHNNSDFEFWILTQTDSCHSTSLHDSFCAIWLCLCKRTTVVGNCAKVNCSFIRLSSFWKFSLIWRASHFVFPFFLFCGTSNHILTKSAD